MSTAEPAYLVLYLIMFAVIAPGVWALHRNGKEALRNALIWLGLLLLVYAVYDHLNPLADVDLSGPQRDL